MGPNGCYPPINTCQPGQVMQNGMCVFQGFTPFNGAIVKPIPTPSPLSSNYSLIPYNNSSNNNSNNNNTLSASLQNETNEGNNSRSTP